jgi:hypothetical protein
MHWTSKIILLYEEFYLLKVILHIQHREEIENPLPVFFFLRKENRLIQTHISIKFRFILLNIGHIKIILT